MLLLDLALIVGGALLLGFAGDRLIDFAAGLGEKANLTPAVIGLTVVAAGTSAPELFVSTTAALSGSPTIALGNVVGSNIANIALILGCAALLAVMPVADRLVRFEYPFMLAASVALFGLAWDGRIDRIEAGGFLVAMAGFLGYSIHAARRIGVDEWSADKLPTHAHALKSKSALYLLAGLTLAFVGLAVGADFLVRGAMGMARAAGISERVIGLTVVAIGTSLPELVATSSAALKHQHEMAVASIVGSNIFNILLIIGVTGLIRPVPAVERLVTLDMPIMLAFSLLLAALFIRGRKLGRAAGGVLLASYVTYIAWLVNSPR